MFELKPDGRHDVDAANLMLQTGYLTVAEYDKDKGMRLDFPNDEVREAFHVMTKNLLSPAFGILLNDVYWLCMEIRRAFNESNFARVAALFNRSRRAAPHANFRGGKENVYREHIRLLLKYSLPHGRVRGEVPDLSGDTDLVVEVGRVVWLIEVKYVDKTTKAKGVMTMLRKGLKQVCLRTCELSPEWTVRRAAIVVRERIDSEKRKKMADANVVVAAEELGGPGQDAFEAANRNVLAELIPGRAMLGK